MTQQQSPWIEGAYGWNFGEGGWNSGMDQNLLKFSFMFDRNVDSITAALPAAVNGQAHYLTTDNRLYFAVGATYFSTPIPKWFTIAVRGTGTIWQFNGTALIQIDSPQQLDSRIDAVELTVSTLGTAAFKNIEFFAEQSELDVAVANAANYTDALRTDLASTTDPAKGAALVFNGSQSLAILSGDRYVMRTGATAADLLAATATGLEVVIPAGVSITIDNSAGVGLTLPGDGIRISGKGSLIATGDGFDMIRSTGTDFWLDGVTLQGPGTYRPDLGAGGEPPALVACRGSRAIVSRTKQVNPFGAGVFIRAAQGAKVLFNKIESGYVGSIAQPFLFQIYLRVAADTLVYGNTCIGGIQGVCGGGDGSGVLTVTNAAGVADSKLINTLIAGNTCVNQLDHSIYFSNDSVNTKILDNPELVSTNEPIKIEGGPNQVARNTGKGGLGLIGRNVHDTLIEDNTLTSTLSSINAYGILLFDRVFKRPLDNVTIRGNRLIHTGAESKGAIYVIGDVWDGYQSVIKNLKIHDNTCVGYGATAEGFGIGVFQTLFAGSPVTGALGKNVSIQGNVIEFPAHNVATYGIDLGRGLQSGNVQNNTINGFRSIGVRLLGVQDFNLSGNTLIADPAATGVFGFNERAKDLTVHYNSQGNRYGQNTYKGTFARQVQHSDETCYNSDRVIVRRTGGLSSDTVIATLWPKQYVFNNHTADAVITLDALASGPWPIDSDITITNAAAANSLTVNPGGFAVAAGTSLRLVCTGSNAFIKAN